MADFEAAAAQRVIVREAELEQRARLLRSHVTARVGEVLAWPVGRPCPFGRMAEAWVVHRYGAAMAIARGTSAAGATLGWAAEAPASRGRAL